MSSHTKNETITDKLLALDILEKIKISKALLSINIPDIEENFISMILNVDEQLKSITIDGLNSNLGQKLLSTSKILSVETHLRGVPVKFDSLFLKTEKDKDYRSHQIRFPEKMEYFQKRKELRVTISIGLHVGFHIRVKQQWQSIGRITDISTGGVGLLTNEKEKNFIHQLNHPIICRIQFDKKTSFHCKLTLCHTLYDESSRRYQVGTNFEGLTLQDVNKLSRMIRIFDRDNIRKEIRQTP